MIDPTPDSMRVVQAVWGKFHHFDLARELHARGMLERVFSTYPMWKLRKEGIPHSMISSFPWFHLVALARQRAGWANPSVDRPLQRYIAESFDRFLTLRKLACDVFIGLSGSGMMIGPRVQAEGGAFVCDRGSSHIRFCDEILAEEHSRWKLPYQRIDPYFVHREEREYTMADALTVPSSFAARTYISRGIPASKIRVIPYGVSLTRFSKMADPASDRFEVLFVGQASLRKGIPYLLEAFEHLKVKKKRLRLVGSVSHEIARWVQGRKLDHVEFVGHVNQERLAEMMNGSHVMVLPSIEDGFGMVLCQAMACGCPVVASDNSGGPDVIQSGREGLLFPARSSKCLLACLQRLADDPELRTMMGNAALMRVKSWGGWNEYGNAFEQLCRGLRGGMIQETKNMEVGAQSEIANDSSLWSGN